MKNKYWILLGLLSLTAPALAQEQQTKEGDLYELSLEELMNVPINSASKKDESLFDAPLSSYTITRADIDKAGSTSIMEALRLAPGVIVREQTNGVYDIHIRGFDNVQRTSEAYTKSNLATLVMIDNRPVFNHNLGGTFWEALPVDLNDVERIEVVRGPSAPLFGPNAVTGVINIITKRASSRINATANVQLATPSTTIANAGFGMKTSEKFNFSVSGNYQKRERYDENYYNSASGEYQPAADFINNASTYFPDASLAMEKHGVNAFANYKPTENISFDLSLGEQKSTTQKVFLGGATYFTTNETSSKYANLNTKIYGLNVRASVNGGTDNLNKGAAPAQYDFTVGDVTAEYTFSLGQNVSIVPGVSYQSVKFTDKDYVNDGPTFLGGQDATINTSAGFLRVDARPISIWRVIAAVRADKFSSPDDVYVAYEFANTVKLNDKNLIRAAITRSNSGSFIGLNYLALSVPTGFPGVNFERTGNRNLKLLTVDMVEVGFRSQLSKSLQLDIDIFRQHAENFTTLATTSPISQEFQDTNTTIVQNGMTLSLNFVPNDKIQFKPFVTVQKSETSDLPTADAYDKEHKNTPSFYGGYFFNYKPVSKLNVNLNGYYFAAHRQYDSEDPAATGTTGDIKGKFLLNAKINYAISSHVSIFVNGRNVLATDSREFYGADSISGLYMAGATFSFN